MVCKNGCCVHRCDGVNRFNPVLLHIWWSSGLLTCFRQSKSDSFGLESISVGGFRDIMAAVFWSHFSSHPIVSYSLWFSSLKFNGFEQWCGRESSDGANDWQLLQGHNCWSGWLGDGFWVGKFLPQMSTVGDKGGKPIKNKQYWKYRVHRI